ncbi:putative inorganic carbon transporter subunit DabA, partial [Falsiroseomonas oryziterrae]|uniref:putative inorganic carbon transporter subunit DabA n=1 Tax=Falsiroseomonas oryziterrae TaxID=2911368 RepID=UPI001F32113C
MLFESLACDDGAAAPTGLSPAEQVATAEGALRIMGLTAGFAPLVLLCGHGGEAVNNPFAAGLDCGACGGNRGGPNARIMAAILNEAGVREGLAARGIVIPAETVFLAAEHNTTTDELVIWETAAASRHAGILARLRADLATARTGAAAERLGRLPGGAVGDAV